MAVNEMSIRIMTVDKMILDQVSIVLKTQKVSYLQIFRLHA